MFTHFCKRCHLAIGLGSATAALALSPVAPAATVIRYVDVNIGTSGNGETWGTAKKDLRDGLADAVSWIMGHPGDEVQLFVAQGTYKPDLGTGVTPGDPDATFSLASKVFVLGGFASGDTLAQRNPATKVTILSGNIGNQSLATDNSHVVVTAPQNMTGPTFTPGVVLGNLDGFTVQDAYEGNGIVADFYASPLIRNCKITANTGGGIWIKESSVAPTVIRNCEIFTNTGTYGAGVFSDGGGSVILLNSSFHDNTASHTGGGLYSPSGDVTLIDCTFHDNAATAQDGGGADVGGLGTKEIVNCLFHDNSAGAFGGGLHARGGTINLANITVADNEAGTTGGGIALKGTATVTIKSSIVWDNTAPNLPEIDDGTGVTISYSDIKRGLPTAATDGGNNIDSNPNFTNAAAGNYRLACVSPCINAGDIAAASAPGSGGFPIDALDVDENGNSAKKIPDRDLTNRIKGAALGLPYGERIDMGAFETAHPVRCAVGDIVPYPCGNGVVNVDDLLAVINGWGPCADATDCPADIAEYFGYVTVDDLLAVINSWGPCPGVTGGEEGLPQSVEDCIDRASSHYTPYSPAWTAYVNSCCESLCVRNLIDCD